MLNITDIQSARGRRTMTNGKGQKDALHLHVADFTNLSAAMIVLAELAPDRMTMSQAIFFLVAGTADLAGKRPTYSDVREALGDDINRTLHTTYRVVLEPSRVYPKGLGWMTRDQNPSDNRQWFLRLTPKGRMVLKEVLRAMGKEID